MREMTRLEQERQETQVRESALAASVASKKKQLLTDLVKQSHYLVKPWQNSLIYLVKSDKTVSFI
jgi:hypothetical protein